MAYNVLKGNIQFSGDDNGTLECMVDNHSTQVINGHKEFSNAVSASVFWDTTNNKQVAPPAITSITSDGNNRVLTSDGDGTATAESSMTYDGTTLTATNVSVSYLTGAAGGLTNIPVDQFVSTIPASSIEYDLGLTLSGNALVVEVDNGISVGEDGLTINLASNEGLTLSGSYLTLDPTNITDVTSGGQNLADSDVLIVEDVSHGLRKTTLTNFYSNYISSKISSPAITTYTNSTNNRLLTSVDGTSVNGEANLTFDGALLTVTGETATTVLTATSLISGSAAVSGSSLWADGLPVGPAVGLTGEIQLKGSNGLLWAEGDFSYDIGTSILSVPTIKTTTSLNMSGSVVNRIRTVTSNHTVADTDYTILADTNSGNVTISLPPAIGIHLGRTIQIKKIHSNNTLYIAPSGLDNLDGVNVTESISNDNALRAIQSDGINWWYTARYN